MHYNKNVLGNGLRIVTIPMKDNPTATVLILVAAGSKYETKAENGISHFLEHMCFKGTAKRPRAIDISHELDAIGAQYNAFTGSEYTGYYAKGSARHVELLLDVVSDIYLNSTLPEGEMEKEKGVIIEEINMYNDLPQRKVQENFTALLYGDQPAGWGITGTKESVSRMKRTSLVHYRQKFYTAPETVLIVSGAIDEQKILDLAQRHLVSSPKEKGLGKLPVVEAQGEPKVSIETKQTDQSHFVLGVRTFNIYDKRNPALKVLSGILGGGMSSRLFEKMRNELGICYYVGVSPDGYTDHGNFSVYAGVRNDRLKEAVGEILKQLSIMIDHLVSEKEMSKVREFLVGQMYLGLESSDSLADFYGGQEILEKPIKKPEAIAEEIMAVKSEEVRNLAKQIFKNDMLNLAVIGPQKDESELRPLLRF